MHGAGPQISAEMERAGIPVEFVGGRRVTTRGRHRGRARLAAGREHRPLGRARRARCPSSGSTSACAPSRSPALGLVGDPVPARRRAAPHCDQGKLPVIAPLAAGPLNVNADDAAARSRLGVRRRACASSPRRRLPTRRRGRRLARRRRRAPHAQQDQPEPSSGHGSSSARPRCYPTSRRQRRCQP